MSRRRTLARLALVAIACVVAILGADLVLRLFAGGWLYYREHERFVERWPELPVVTRYESNVDDSAETFGDLAAMIGREELREPRRVVFRTDSFGFRNDEKPRDRRPYDLIVLGDSFGVGTGTTQERTWVSLLQGRQGLEVYNLSMPGSPLHHSVNLATQIERLPVHAGSLVLLALFSGNDLDDDYPDPWVKLSSLPWSRPGERLAVRLSTFLRRSPLRQLVERRREGQRSAADVLVRDFPEGRKVLFFRPYAERRKRTQAMVRSHPHYGRLLAAIRDIRRVAGEHRLPLGVLLLPSKEEVYEWSLEGSPPWTTDRRPSGFARAVGEFCRRDGLGFFDLEPALVEAAQAEHERSGRLLYWTDDTHWNETGHAVVADLAVRQLLPALSPRDGSARGGRP
ncbi:MAG TPA: GDSL-type esterase/lipase family protein [Thermoanaerobaculia bacterium]|nr:GDSL-type esterase/lipase family protein [Thermoanaerobaculia bacterium]